jgi:hypothetical protein
MATVGYLVMGLVYGITFGFMWYAVAKNMPKTREMIYAFQICVLVIIGGIGFFVFKMSSQHVFDFAIFSLVWMGTKIAIAELLCRFAK